MGGGPAPGPPPARLVVVDPVPEVHGRHGEVAELGPAAEDGGRELRLGLARQIRSGDLPSRMTERVLKAICSKSFSQ